MVTTGTRHCPKCWSKIRADYLCCPKCGKFLIINDLFGDKADADSNNDQDTQKKSSDAKDNE